MQFIKNTSAREKLSSWPALILLACVLIAGTGSYAHSQLLKVGAWIWGDDYFLLRADIAKPTCDAHLNIEKKFIWYLLIIALALVGVFFFGTASDIMKPEGRNWHDCVHEKYKDSEKSCYSPPLH